MDEQPIMPPKSPPKKRNQFVFAVVMVAVLLAAGLFGLIWLRSDEQKNSAPNSADSVQVTPQLSFIPREPKPTVETDAFDAHHNSEYFFDDIADDSAIWVNPDNPNESLVIANNKAIGKGGIAVFDMQGKMLQYEQIASIGNVDLRSDFDFNGAKITLVGANDQTNSTLIFWKLNPETRRLERLETDGKLSTVKLNYGFCMYRSANSNKYYALVTQDDKGFAEQYEIKDVNGKIGLEKLRTLDIDKSQAEGCVFDDELGKLFVAVEKGAIWQYGAEPDSRKKRTKIDDIDGKNLTADIEGMAIAYGPDNSGYMVVSSQGSSTYAVYDRQTGKFLKTFSVGKNGDIDGVSETDGLDVSTANLGAGFEHGALVVHDHANEGDKTSNLKYVPLVASEN